MIQKENTIFTLTQNKHTFMLLSIDLEYNILRPIVRQITDLVWPVSEPTNLKGNSTLELHFQVVMTPC